MWQQSRRVCSRRNINRVKMPKYSRRFSTAPSSLLVGFRAELQWLKGTHQGPGLGTALFDVFVDHVSAGSKDQPGTERQGHQTVEDPRLVWEENKWKES